MFTAVNSPRLTRRQIVTSETPSSLATAFAARKPVELVTGFDASFVCMALLFQKTPWDVPTEWVQDSRI
jgi:hypothetical protein